jgi:hypothetical protein
MAKQQKQKQAVRSLEPGLNAVFISLADGVFIDLQSSDAPIPYLIQEAERLAKNIKSRSLGDNVYG